MSVSSPSRAGMNPRYARYQEMAAQGISEGDVGRKMQLAGFSKAEIKTFFDGDIVGPNCVPAPHSFSRLKVKLRRTRR